MRNTKNRESFGGQFLLQIVAGSSGVFRDDKQVRGGQLIPDAPKRPSQ